MEKIQNPHSDSTRARNISRLPIPMKDNRLIIWELERKKIKPIQINRQEEQLMQEGDYIFYY